MAVGAASSASRSTSTRSSSASKSSSSSKNSNSSNSSNSTNTNDASGTRTQTTPPSNYIAAPETQKAAETARNSLQQGHGGQSVADMQRELNQSGANLQVDGKFGPKTDAAVRAYQANAGLTVDGKAGTKTLGSLYNDGRGADAYAGKSATAAPNAPTATQTAATPAGTTKAASVQRPINARAPRNKPPVGLAPNRGGSANNPPAAKPDANTIERAAAQQQATSAKTPKKAGLQDRPANGNPANKTASFDKVSKTGQRNQMVSGRITVNGKTYDFRSGGHGRGNLPAGEYKISPHLYSRNDKSMSVGGVGYSYAVSDKYDKRVGGTRSLLRIHPDGRSPGTMGCIGIVGDAATQRQFRNDMQAELARNGGSFNLRVG